MRTFNRKMLSTSQQLLLFHLIVVIVGSHGKQAARYLDRGPPECVLLKANASYARQNGESYIELGSYSMRSNEEFTIEFYVKPDKREHNGPMFSIGTDNFAYYEWKTKAVKQQFFVVEFVYSAFATLIKALGQQHMLQLEIYRTWPVEYSLDVNKWHHVKVSRINQGPYAPMRWQLNFDDLVTLRNESEKTNVNINDMQAYLGARPGFSSTAFRGIIKDLRIDGERVALRNLARHGLVEVWHCTSPQVDKFVEELQNAYTKPASTSPRQKNLFNKNN